MDVRQFQNSSIKINSKKRRMSERRQRPKYLTILKKSKYIKHWLVKNPWMRPMCVFNYVAIKIQQHFRGFLVRRKSLRKKYGKKLNLYRDRRVKPSSTRKLIHQLDKYLSYLDEFKSKNTNKRSMTKPPMWISGGYSSWCAARIQAWWRMLKVNTRYRYRLRLVNQVAAIVIQTAWRNITSYFKKGVREVITRSSKHSYTSPFLAAHAIQLCWRSYCNKRIYRYFRDLIKIKLKGAPNDLLRTIIPNEADLFDKAAGVHVRFRLGSSIFPPKIFFKVFTHKPVCDVNSFAPRDYSKEKNVDMLHNNLKTSHSMLRNDMKSNMNAKYDNIKVGTRYFDTILTTSNPEGTSNWYKRDENNNWRAISSHLFEDLLAPPWFKELGHFSKPKPYHFSQLKRKQDLNKMKKLKKRQWMIKAYMMSSYADAKGINEEEKDRKEYNAYNNNNNNNNNMMIMRSDSKRNNESHSWDYKNYSMEGGSPSKTIDKQNNKQEIEEKNNYSFQKNIITNNKTNHKHSKNEDIKSDLIDWSLALDFDEYMNEWSSIGVSMPSDIPAEEMYRLAGNQSTHIRQQFYGK
eukprot:gene8426-11396_t